MKPALITRAISIGKKWLAAWVEQVREREDQAFLVLTLLIGALVSLAVVALILLTERLGARLYPAGGAAWRRVLVPIVGSLGTGYILYRYAPDARGGGLPRTKAALFVSGGRITFGTVFSKFFCTAATLASGIPLGYEGPSVQVGAGIASVLGRKLGLSRDRVKELIPVGGSAAIAAAFNAPLGGVLFALEELVGDLNAPVLGSVVLSAATSWIVLRLLLGNEPLFHVPQYEFVHPIEFGIYALLGLVGGMVSVVFVKSLLHLRQWFINMPRSSVWFQPVAGGALVGIVGWFVPEVLGVGYAHVGDALNGNMAFRVMAMLVVLKLATVVMAYASGNAGGIFGPSLFIGAMVGGAVGTVAHRLLPTYTATAGAYALVGMGALFAGIIRAPMTSVIMIFEVTHDYAVIVPLMIANLVSFYLSRRWQPKPIYEAMALQEGIHLPGGEIRETASRFRVDHVMRAPSEIFQHSDPIAIALERARSSQSRSWLVVDDRGIVGIVPLSALERAHADGAGEKPVSHLIDSESFPHVHEDQSLETALHRLGQSGLDSIPVVSRANVRELKGVVTVADILKHYGVGKTKTG